MCKFVYFRSVLKMGSLHSDHDEKKLFVKIFNKNMDLLSTFEEEYEVFANKFLNPIFSQYNPQDSSLTLFADMNISANPFAGRNLIYVSKYKLNLNTLSVSQIEQPTFSLSPNPASNQIQIQYTRQDFSQYFISDLQGRKIKSGNIDPQSAQSEIDVQELSQGIYLLSLQGKKGGVVKKFVKQ